MSDPFKLKPLPPLRQLQVLCVLGMAEANGQLSLYGQQIVDQSNGHITIGSVYVLLDRLMANRWITREVIREHIPGKRRPRYALTPSARLLLRAITDIERER